MLFACVVSVATGLSVSADLAKGGEAEEDEDGGSAAAAAAGGEGAEGRAVMVDVASCGGAGTVVVFVVFRRCAWRGSVGVVPLKGREDRADDAAERRGPDAVRRCPASRAAASAALRAPLRARCILACGAWGKWGLVCLCWFSLLLGCALLCFALLGFAVAQGKGPWKDGQDTQKTGGRTRERTRRQARRRRRQQGTGMRPIRLSSAID
jgi:hypothetical protein